VSWQTGAPGGGEAVGSKGTRPEPAGAPIAAVCAETGLSARTLRYYEELGLLPGVRRRAGGRRVYGSDELQRLRFIQRLKALGLTLAEIRELNAVHALGGSTQAMLLRLAELLDRRLGDLDARIRELATLREEIERYRERVARRAASHGRGSARREGRRA
jgi:DNA-binding transcriptional MerR regulator